MKAGVPKAASTKSCYWFEIGADRGVDGGGALHANKLVPSDVDDDEDDDGDGDEDDGG